MPSFTIQRSCLLPYEAGQIRKQVEDVSSYPEYLPGCVGARVFKDDGSVQRAQLDIAWAGFKGQLTTINTRTPQGLNMLLEEGPVRSLQGEWRIEEYANQSCRIELDVLLRTYVPVPNALLQRVANQLMQAMVDRADQLYG